MIYDWRRFCISRGYTKFYCAFLIIKNCIKYTKKKLAAVWINYFPSIYREYKWKSKNSNGFIKRNVKCEFNDDSRLTCENWQKYYKNFKEKYCSNSIIISLYFLLFLLVAVRQTSWSTRATNCSFYVPHILDKKNSPTHSHDHARIHVSKTIIFTHRVFYSFL